MLGGQLDKLADPKDVAWTHDQMKSTVIFYHQYYLGHMSFAIAKDMSWFDVDVMAIINHYNNKCDKSTLNSKFDIGNIKCQAEFNAAENFLY